MTANLESAMTMAQQEIERFSDAMWMERGLSKNTLAAYQSDLSGLAGWLANNNRGSQKEGKILMCISLPFPRKRPILSEVRAV